MDVKKRHEIRDVICAVKYHYIIGQLATRNPCVYMGITGIWSKYKQLRLCEMAT